MKKCIVSLVILISLFVLASCGASPSTTTTQRPVATTASSTPTITSTTQPVGTVVPTTVAASPPRVHLQLGTGVQLAHFYVTVTRAELHTVQTPPAGMTYLLVTATLRNTTNVDRPLFATNYILHDASGKAYVAHVYSGTPAPPYGVVKPGTTILGPLVFLVPVPQVLTHYTFTYQWTGGLAQASWDLVI